MRIICSPQPRIVPQPQKQAEVQRRTSAVDGRGVLQNLGGGAGRGGGGGGGNGSGLGVACMVRVSDRNLHSRLPLDPTHVRLKRPMAFLSEVHSLTG
jgi:hypothetical protein